MRRLFLRGILVVVTLVGSRSVRAQDELFVVSRGPDAVDVYTRTANGNIAPLRAIAGAATGISTPFGMVVDTVNDEVIVANEGANSITVYGRTASGNVAPLRTIIGAATLMNGATSLALDTVNNELMVANLFGNSITVYSRTANGNVRRCGRSRVRRPDWSIRPGWPSTW